MWAAMRYRRGQAALLVILSAIVTAAAVFGPLYAREVDHGLLRDAVNRASVLETALVSEQSAQGQSRPIPSSLEAAMPGEVEPYFGPPVATWFSRATVTGGRIAGGAPVDVLTYGVADRCARLVITEGSCPSAATEVLVSTKEAQIEGWRVGQSIGVQPWASGAASGDVQRLRISGTYDQLGGDAAWFGVRLTGRAGTVVTQGLGSTPQMDALVVSDVYYAPVSTGAPDSTTPIDVTLTVARALRRDALDVDALPSVVAAVERAESLTPTSGERTRSDLDQIGAVVLKGQQQAAVLIPLLMGQLALLAVVILGLAASAAVEQRRPEIALARLRGNGVGGARRHLLNELGALVAMGVPLGVAMALAMGELARRFWLPDGVPFLFPLSAAVAAAAALAVGIAAVLLVARPRLRESIPSLLRRIPARQRGFAVGMLDAVIITVASAAVLTIVTGNASGPLAMATPALLSLAIGLMLALLVVPVATRWGHRSVVKGSLLRGLTAVHIARRPAVRRVISIATVACALLVFAADAYVVASHNRDARSRLEVGAEAVLQTDSRDAISLRSALGTITGQLNGNAPGKGNGPGNGVDTGPLHLATPVATLTRSGPDAPATVAVVPDDQAQLGATNQTAALPWASLTAPRKPPVTLQGSRIEAVFTDVDLRAAPPAASRGEAPGDSIPFTLSLRKPDGTSENVTLGDLPMRGKGPYRLSSIIGCASGCTVDGLGVDRYYRDDRIVFGSLRLSSLAVGGQSPLDLSRSSWLAPTYAGIDVSTVDPTTIEQSLQGRGYMKVEVAPNGAPGLKVDVISVRSMVEAPYDSPVLPAWFVAPPSGDRSAPTAVAALGTVDVPVEVTRSPASVPGAGANVVLVDYDALAARGSHLYSTGSLSVWVAAEADVPAVTKGLADVGIAVVAEHGRAGVLDGYDQSASAWSMRLALVIGGVGLALAVLALVLVTVTSWRVRSTDFAALRSAGLSRRVTRGVAVSEQLVVVLLASVAGALSGWIGSRLALRLVPLFTIDSPLYHPDLSPAVGPMVVVAVASTVCLGLVAVALGVWLSGKSERPGMKEQL